MSRGRQGSSMTVFRFIAWVFVGIAIALLGADGISSLEQKEPVIRSTAEVLALFGLDGYAVAEASPGGIKQALTTVMGVPLWSIIGLIGIVLTLIFRPID